MKLKKQEKGEEETKKQAETLRQKQRESDREA